MEKILLFLLKDPEFIYTFNKDFLKTYQVPIVHWIPGTQTAYTPIKQINLNLDQLFILEYLVTNLLCSSSKCIVLLYL